MNKITLCVALVLVAALSGGWSFDKNITAVYKCRSIEGEQADAWIFMPNGTNMVARPAIKSTDNKGVQHGFVGINTATSMVVLTEVAVRWEDALAAGWATNKESAAATCVKNAIEEMEK